MVRAMAVLLLCQLAGTVVQQATGLPLPGPVMGLVLLLGILAWQGGPSATLRDTAQGLLKYLGLLFVPAGVGVVTELRSCGPMRWRSRWRFRFRRFWRWW
jgi:holin-like protein